jgi:hypothetical protein
MNRLEQDQLLREILNGDAAAPLREASLVRGLALLKLQRRRRIMARMTALVVIPLLIAGLALSNRGFWPADQGLAKVIVKPMLPAAAARGEAEGVKSITADELFALLPHHSLALIGKPGHQRLICLDQPGDNGIAAVQSAQ